MQVAPDRRRRARLGQPCLREFQKGAQHSIGCAQVRPAKRSRIAPGGPEAKRNGIPDHFPSLRCTIVPFSPLAQPWTVLGKDNPKSETLATAPCSTQVNPLSAV